MKVILTKPVAKLGEAGDVVQVKGGFARNFLLPQQLAILADAKNMKVLAHQKKTIEDKRRRELASIRDRIEKVESKSITIMKKAGEQGKLFGSVTSADVIEALQKEGIDFVDKKQVQLEEPIKELGVFTVPIRLAQDHVAQLKLFVVNES